MVIALGLFVVPLTAGAVTGACSGHDGVNCALGADTDGSVVCNDEWTDSSVNYTEEVCGDEYVAPVLEEESEFSDVDLDDDNADAIEFLTDAEVVKGYDDGTFKPEFKINRAELAKVLVEAQGVTPDADQYRNCFTDVADEWFAPYVCYAKDVEWVKGYKDGSFAPEKPVNKVESIKMLVNSQGFGGEVGACSGDLFEDVDADSWYGNYLCVALKRGFLEEGIDDDYFPGNSIVRSEVAENIYRAVLVRKLEKEQFKAEYKEMKGDALELFKTDRGLIKAEIDSFRDELEQLKEDGEDADYIKAEREEFWDNMKELHKNNSENFQQQLQKAHELLKQQREQAKEKFKACKEGSVGNGAMNGSGSGKCDYFSDDLTDDDDDSSDVDDDDDDDDDVVGTTAQ